MNNEKVKFSPKIVVLPSDKQSISNLESKLEKEGFVNPFMSSYIGIIGVELLKYEKDGANCVLWLLNPDKKFKCHLDSYLAGSSGTWYVVANNRLNQSIMKKVTTSAPRSYVVKLDDFSKSFENGLAELYEKINSFNQ